jgi:hypothetical protein
VKGHFGHPSGVPAPGGIASENSKAYGADDPKKNAVTRFVSGVICHKNDQITGKSLLLS